jgi:hypothetical protein
VERNTPGSFALLQNYPNPFNPTTTITYEVASASRIRLKIFDLLGNEVATLVDQTTQPGSYTTAWDASKLASGIYFSRLTADPLGAPADAQQHYTDVRKMVLLK